MKYINCIPFSEEWVQLRLGVVTASDMHRIFTPKKMELSKSADAYLLEKLAEWRLKQPVKPDLALWAVERGREYEEEACSFFTLTTGLETKECGFFLTDDGRVGASPDRIVLEDNSLLEIKNHLAHSHLAHLMAGVFPQEHVLQTQAQLFVTEAKASFLLLYHPGLPAMQLKSEPIPEIQKKMHEGLTTFCDRLDAMKQKLLDLY